MENEFVDLLKAFNEKLRLKSKVEVQIQELSRRFAPNQKRKPSDMIDIRIKFPDSRFKSDQRRHVDKAIHRTMLPAWLKTLLNET